jgi:hemerythrin
MAIIVWSSELNIGIDVIDKQHMRIADYINRMHEAIERNDMHEIADLFDELIDYTQTHFTFEEEIQRKARYEFCSAHKRVHMVFIKKLAEYKAQFDKGDIEIAQRVLDMLSRWLINHIKHDDADYLPAVMRMMNIKPKKKSWVTRVFG